MKLLLASLFSLQFLLASNIINHNIYERVDRVDILLLFDSPFDGKITKKEDSDSTVLILEDANINKKTIETINSKIIQNFNLTPHKNQIFVEINSKNPFAVTASKTEDNFSLRIRVTPKYIMKEQNKLLDKISKSNYSTKQDSQEIGSAFIKVILILIFLVAVLYFLKKWLENRANGGKNWLFKSDTNTKEKIKILNQRALDTKNRVAVIGYGDYKYLVILGNNNVLLDKFKNDEVSEDNFEDILEDNNQKLDQFIKSKTDKLSEYKEKLKF